MMTKCNLDDICIPGLKYMLSLNSEMTTETSRAHYVAMLDETADCKDRQSIVEFHN
jgi:hypothetical protein